MAKIKTVSKPVEIPAIHPRMIRKPGMREGGVKPWAPSNESKPVKLTRSSSKKKSLY